VNKLFTKITLVTGKVVTITATATTFPFSISINVGINTATTTAANPLLSGNSTF
jgi:hypothetical protein